MSEPAFVALRDADPDLTEMGAAAAPRPAPLPDRLLLLVTLPVVAVVHVVLVLLTIAGRLNFLFNDATHRLGKGTDLVAYYDAGVAWLSGISIYGYGAAFGYRYHPFLAMTAGATMARGSIDHAYVMYVAACETFFVLDLLILSALIPSARRFLCVALLFACFSPYYLEIFMGNVSFLAASIMLAAWFFDRSGMRLLFLALFCLSVGVKPTGLVLIPLLFVQRRSADALIILLVTALMAAPYFIVHPADLSALWTSNVRGNAAGWLVHAGNQGFHGLVGDLLTRLSGIRTSDLSSYRQLPAAAGGLLAVLPIGAAAVALYASIRARGDVALGIFLWSAVYLLGFHDVWEHSYSILLVALGLLIASGTVNRGALWVGSIGLALPTGFMLYDLALPPGPYDPEHAWGMGVSVLHHATKPVFLLVLFAAVIAACRRPLSVRSSDARI